jgi:hypothetical protein
VAASAAASGEPPRDMAVATGLQQEVEAAAATAVASASPAPIPVADDQVVVDIADDDAPPPGWSQWGNQPASAPERASGVLVMREEDCALSQCPAHGAEASSSRSVLPAPVVTDTHLERGPGHAGAPPATLMKPRPNKRCGRSFETTALDQQHAERGAAGSWGPSWRIFHVRVFARFEAWSFTPLTFAHFLISRPPASCLLATGAGGPSPGEVQLPCLVEL